MSKVDHTTTAIIPTLASVERRDALERAVQSLFAAVSKPETLQVIVAVNGSRYDNGVLQWLRRQPLRVIRITEGSAPLAHLIARKQVKSPYYCFLDDDDEYLPGAIDKRIAVLDRAGGGDLVVTNGWRRTGASEERNLSRLESVSADPLAALFEENWLASCGALFRTDTIGVDFFEEYHPYLEWTWLAFRIAVAKKHVVTTDEVTYRINDTENSVSKSQRYIDAELSLYQRMLASVPRLDVQTSLRRRIQNQFSMRSMQYLRAGETRKAWSALWKVYSQPEAWRYSGLLARVLIESASQALRLKRRT